MCLCGMQHAAHLLPDPCNPLLLYWLQWVRVMSQHVSLLASLVSKMQTTGRLFASSGGCSGLRSGGMGLLAFDSVPSVHSVDRLPCQVQESEHTGCTADRHSRHTGERVDASLVPHSINPTIKHCFRLLDLKRGA